MNNFINWQDISIIVLDFDGIFTDNKVFLNDQGEEFVCCNRSDGLGFEILKSFAKNNNWDPDIIVLTKEKNKAALSRCNKLNLKCINSIDDKASYLKNNYKKYLNKSEDKISNLVYLGNDLNDMESIKLAQFSVVPIDAHPIIKKYSTYILDIKGGDGFIRLFIEKLIQIHDMNEKQISNIL